MVGIQCASDHSSVVCLFCASPLLVDMAGGEPAGFGYWIGVLVNSGGLDLKQEVPKEKRSVFRKLARLLVRNEFEHVDELRNGVSFCAGACADSGTMCWQARIQVDGLGRMVFCKASWTCWRHW